MKAELIFAFKSLGTRFAYSKINPWFYRQATSQIIAEGIVSLKLFSFVGFHSWKTKLCNSLRNKKTQNKYFINYQK